MSKPEPKSEEVKIEAIRKDIIHDIQQNLDSITNEYKKIVEEDTYLIYSEKIKREEN